MLKERYTVIKSAQTTELGNIIDEVKLLHTFNLPTALLTLKKLDDNHCVVVEKFDGKEWLYVQDSEMYK